jgi:CubicO group peptidase (beta-lactamase class C family)
MGEDVQHRLAASLLPLFLTAIKDRVFPGAAVAVSFRDSGARSHLFFEYGASTFEKKTSYSTISQSTFFDLASLTKPLATTLAILQLFSGEKVRLDDSLQDLLDSVVPFSHKQITLRHLLSHSSGLEAYRPFFRKLSQIPQRSRRQAVEKWIMEKPLAYRTGEKSLYSDLGFLLLGFIVEEKSGLPLDMYVTEKIMEPLSLQDEIFFNRLSRNRKVENCVPTESCPWRKKTLCGQVHDDNAFCLDGVAGHAGLFGNANGVLALTELLLDFWQGRINQPVLGRREDLKRFLTRQADIPGSTWALGFDTPSEKNSSSGRYFSPFSVGHLGFTGTSFWIDPQRDLSVVLLTNRVHPHRENAEIRQFRPLFHDRISESLGLT